MKDQQRPHRSVRTSSFLGLGIALIVLLVVGGVIFFSKGNDPARIATLEEAVATPVLYTQNGDGTFRPLDFTEVAAAVTDAVVHIRSTVEPTVADQQSGQPNVPDAFRDFFGDDFFRRFDGPQRGLPQVGSGSGVVIEPNGYIVTNNHVIDGATSVEVLFNDNRSYEAEIIGTDPNTDLALLKIEEENLETIAFDDSDVVKVGEWVMAVGNPFNLNSTVTAGIVSAKGRSINILQERYAIESFIQTDAAINPGNSGGALVNLRGGLIGINTAIASPTGSYSGYGFAVPSNLVQKVVRDLLEFGTVQRGYLGVTIRNVNSQVAEEAGLDVLNGVLVDSVMENSAAETAGILPGDVILKVNDNATTTVAQLQERIATFRPGESLDITLLRNGKQRTLKTKLKGQSGEERVVSRPSTAGISGMLGATFETLSPDRAEALGLEGGVAVRTIGPGRLRNETRMKPGFIITKVDDEPVRSVDQLEEVLSQATGGVLLEGRYPNEDKMRYFALGME